MLKAIPTGSGNYRLVRFPVLIVHFHNLIPISLFLHFFSASRFLYIFSRVGRNGCKPRNNSFVNLNRNTIEFVSDNGVGSQASNFTAIPQRNCHPPTIINSHSTPIHVSSRTTIIRTDATQYRSISPNGIHVLKNYLALSKCGSYDDNFGFGDEKAS